MSGNDGDTRAAFRLFRKGAAGVVLGVTMMGIASQDLSLTVGSTPSTAPRIRMLTLSALELSLSVPPSGGEEALNRWMASQIENGIHDLLVVTYYVGIAVGGVAMIVSGLARYRAQIRRLDFYKPPIRQHPWDGFEFIHLSVTGPTSNSA